jgi:hypothetical protein
MRARTRDVGIRLVCCALLLGACATASEPADEEDAATGDAATGDDADGDDDLGDDDFGEPEVEQPGTEEPAGGEVDQIALELPGLPIGGTSTVVSEDLQCAEVNWSGPPDLIDGIHIEVTAVSFEPPGAFALSEEACAGGDPPCLPTLPTSGEPCTVAIAWTGEPVAGDGQMFFSEGRVICEPGAEQECTEFGVDVTAREPDGITLEPPPERDDGATGGTDGSTDTTDTTDDTAGMDGTDDAGADTAESDGDDGGVDDETDG